MATQEQTYTAEEMGMIAQCMALFDVVDSASGAAQELRCPTTTMEWARAKRDQTTGLLVVRARAVIHGASPQDIVAYSMEYGSRDILSTWDPRVTVRSEVLEIVNDHVYIQRKTHHWNCQPDVPQRYFMDQALHGAAHVRRLCVVH